MKKTFVALAALAAVGAASAQVSLTGSYVFGYESTSALAKAAAAATQTAAVPATKASGFGTDTAAITMTAVEDLGNGMTATAVVSAGGLVRGNSGNVGGENASLSLAGGFGKVDLRSVESGGQGITSKASAGAPGYDLHDKVFSANSNIDQVKYTLPAMGGLTLSVNYVDRGGNNGVGLGQGTSGMNSNAAYLGSTGVGVAAAQAATQASFGAEAAYKAGALDAQIDYTQWTRKAASATPNVDRVRLSGNYDLGMLKLGAGISSLNKDNAGTVTETLVGVSAPFGAAKVGATFGRSKTEGSAAVKTGYTVGAEYALSKSVTVGASTYSWKTAGTAGSNTGTRVLVGKSF